MSYSIQIVGPAGMVMYLQPITGLTYDITKACRWSFEDDAIKALEEYRSLRKGLYISSIIDPDKAWEGESQ